MNISLILKLIRKNFIIIIIILLAILLNFYNSYSKIISTHPKYKLISKWDPVDNNLFYEVYLIGKSILDEQYYLMKSINSILREDQRVNKEDNIFINPEVYFGINIDREYKGFLNENINNESPDFKIMSIFRYFSQDNVNNFYYNYFQYSEIKDFKHLSYSIENDEISSEQINPYGIRIIFNVKTRSEEDTDKAVKEIEEFMNINHENFNNNQLDKIFIFTDSIKNDYLNIIDKLKNNFLLDDDKKLSIIENNIKYSLDKLNKKKILLKEIYQLDQFKIFKNASINVDDLKTDIDIKILTNLVTNIFLFIFFSVLFICLRANLYKLFYDKNN